MKTTLIKQIEEIISAQNIGEDEIVLRLKNLLLVWGANYNSVPDAKDILTLGSENLQMLKECKQGDNVIRTGFTKFDNLFGGLTFGELVVLGGRPSMGKTLLLCNIALNISINHPLLYITLDLSESTLTNRLLSAVSNIEISKLMHPNLSEVEKGNLKDIDRHLNMYKIFISETHHNTLAEFRLFCIKQIAENGVKVIIIDYLQLMTSQEASVRYLKVGSFTHELRKIAKESNVCIIVASQLSRAVEVRGGDKRPQLSDLKDSGAIEQDADKVIFIYRPEYYRISVNEEGYDTTGIAELIMAKNRNGNLGTITLKRHHNATRFIDYSYNENPNYFR